MIVREQRAFGKRLGHGGKGASDTEPWAAARAAEQTAEPALIVY